MKKETIYKIGFAAVGTIACVACVKSYNTSKELKTLLGEMNRLSDGIDVDIPESITKLAVSKAADKAAKAATEKAVTNILDDISEQVSDAITDSIGELKPTIQQNLENQITMVDIDDIKKEVVKKTAGMVFENISIPSFFNGNNNSVADIIKSCNDAGMSSWDIERILKSVNKG